MTTMINRISQLDRDHRNSLIALAAHAEGADDLNAIVDGLGKFSVHLYGAHPYQFDIVDTCVRIEKSITQWPEYDTGKVREDVWKMPLMWGSNSTVDLSLQGKFENAAYVGVKFWPGLQKR